MGKTLKDAMKVLSGQLGNEEFTTLLGATDENAEFTEDGWTTLEEQIKGLMSKEAAINNPDIIQAQISKINEGVDSPVHKELKNKLLFGVEKKLTDLFDKNFDLGLKGKKFDEIMETFTSNMEKFKGNGEASEVAKQEIADLHKKLETAGNEKTQLQQKFEQQLNEFKIDTILKNELDQVKLAEPYQDPVVKDGIYKSAISKAKSKAGFKLGQDGNLIIHHKDDPNSELFDGNTKIESADKLLLPHIQNYVQATPDRKTVDPAHDTPSPSQAPARGPKEMVAGGRNPHVV